MDTFNHESCSRDGYMESGGLGNDPNLAFDFCGYQQCRPDHSFGPLARSVFILHVVVSGKGIFRCQGKEYVIDANHVFLLPPGVETYYTADSKEPWHYCWIAFHGTMASDLVKKAGLSSVHPVIGIRDAAAIEEMILYAMKFPEISTHDFLMRRGMLSLILAKIIEESDSEVRSGTDLYSLSYADYAVRYIQLHFQEKIRISWLAEHIGISRSYLVKVVRESIGMSPQEYLMKVRMEYAAHCINHSDGSIRDVAELCGYDDSLAFSKAFKSYYGISPSECRRRYRYDGYSEESIKQLVENQKKAKDRSADKGEDA